MQVGQLPLLCNLTMSNSYPSQHLSPITNTCQHAALSTGQQQTAHFVDSRLSTLSTTDCPLINNRLPNYLRQMIRDTASCLVVAVQQQQLYHLCLILTNPALLVTVTSSTTAFSSEAQGL